MAKFGELLKKQVNDLIAKPNLVLLLEVDEAELGEEVLDDRNLVVDDAVGDEAVVALVPVLEQLVVEVGVDVR